LDLETAAAPTAQDHSTTHSGVYTSSSIGPNASSSHDIGNEFKTANRRLEKVLVNVKEAAVSDSPSSDMELGSDYDTSSFNLDNYLSESDDSNEDGGLKEQPVQPMSGNSISNDSNSTNLISAEPKLANNLLPLAVTVTKSSAATPTMGWIMPLQDSEDSAEKYDVQGNISSSASSTASSERWTVPLKDSEDSEDDVHGSISSSASSTVYSEG